MSIDGGQYQITTLGFGSNVEPYKVERVIGHSPLRQFLTKANGGRWQVQELAYAPKSNEWFDVYGNEDRRPGEYGHWTGRGMNWNSQCASCHNTDLEKNYDEKTDSYRTTMAEMGVGCEACHGPLGKHVEWRKAYPNTKQAEPSPPIVRREQTLDVCGSCHSRRSELTGDFRPGESFFDHFSLEILDDGGRWFPDGQIKDEDYEFASFLGSRMMQSGVHCRDCHRSDSGTGNDLCMRCHQGNYPGFTKAPAINPATHGHHPLASKGGECMGCHMPATVYMQRHPRHDHGFTIPDPLLTKELGIPNACNRCHADKSLEWAIGYVNKWYGSKMNRHTRERARWIGAAMQKEEGAKQPLLRMLSANSGEPPYWRAVAAGLLWGWADDPKAKSALLESLKDAHPLVRENAARALETQAEVNDPETVAGLRIAISDPVRCVRIAAAWGLRASIDLKSQAAIELQHSLDLEADQPRGQFRKARFLLARKEPLEALGHLQKAVEWDQYSPPLRYEFAMLLDSVGRTDDAMKQLSKAEALDPHDPQFPYARAVLLARRGKTDEARVAAGCALKLRNDFRSARELLEQLTIEKKH